MLTLENWVRIGLIAFEVVAIIFMAAVLWEQIRKR